MVHLIKTTLHGCVVYEFIMLQKAVVRLRSFLKCRKPLINPGACRRLPFVSHNLVPPQLMI